jgi:hypothetical protein
MSRALCRCIRLTGSIERPQEVAGQVFIHDMTHARQIETTSFVPGLVCARLTRANDYIPQIDKPRNKMGLEEQAATVDHWFGRHAGGWQTVEELARNLDTQAAIRDPSFGYIANHIRLGLN